jgi:enamine deaminase RidA (YjgF/YER057c/UK114 family)
LGADRDHYHADIHRAMPKEEVGWMAREITVQLWADKVEDLAQFLEHIREKYAETYFSKVKVNDRPPRRAAIEFLAQFA